jgi:PAS domain S-box-containing protein
MALERQLGSDTMYKMLAECSLTGVFLHQDDKYLFVNEQFAKMHGYGQDELIGMKYTNLIHPEDRQVITPKVKKKISKGTLPQRFEIRRVKKNGKVIWAEVVAVSLEYNGKPATMGNILDITARKEAEIALKNSEERYRSLIELSPYGICIHTRTKIVYANDTLIIMAGLSSEKEVIDKDITEIIHAADVPAVKKQFDKLKQGKRKVVYEAKLKRPDEKEMVVECISTNITYSNKPAIQTVLHDITLSKQASISMKESEEKYRIIFEKAHDGLLLVELDSNLIFDCNHAFERMTGRPRDELINHSIWEIRPQSQQEEALKAFNILKKNHQNVSYEFEILRADGKPLVLDCVTSKVKIHNREYLQVIGRDITESKRTIEALRMAEVQYQGLMNYCTQAAATLEVLQNIVNEMSKPGSKTLVPSTLNPRELEILALASKGMSNKDIAVSLKLSERTVGAHFRSIFGKMSVNSRTEAIYKALRSRWIQI